MSNTTLLQLTLLEAAQAQKHVSVNETFQALDALVQLAVKDRDLTAPPGSPADGDRYIPAAGATGAWAGKDGHVAVYQDGSWAFHVPRAGWRAWIEDEAKLYFFNGAAWADSLTVAGTLAVCQGRLTLTTGVPITVSDVTAASTLYFTPYKGNRIGLYDGTKWAIYAFTERSLALSSLTAGLPYDVFIYDNAGTLTLELAAWTNGTTRATALALQDGVYCKTGALTRRYLGTIYTTSTTTTEDSLAKRFVWNMVNRVRRPMKVLETADSWTYMTNAWRYMNNSAANRLDFVRGLDEDSAVAIASMRCINSTATYRYVAAAVGLDLASGTAHPRDGLMGLGSCNSGDYALFSASYDGLPGLGFHFLAALERTTFASSDTVTWFGDGGGDPATDHFTQHGIIGSVMA